MTATNGRHDSAAASNNKSKSFDVNKRRVQEKLAGLLARPLIGRGPILPHLAAEPGDAWVHFSKHRGMALMPSDI